MYWVVIYILGNLYFNSDGETFISADDLRINLWNLEISNQSFNIIDVKPTNMEDLTGITSKPTNYLLSVLIMCVIGHRCERKYTLSEVDFFFFFILSVSNVTCTSPNLAHILYAQHMFVQSFHMMTTLFSCS